METHAEVARLRQVYREYTARGFARSKWSTANQGNQAIRIEREARTRALLQRSGFFPLTRQRILDVGCGTGEQLGLFLDWGAKPENLFGIDLLPDRIRDAQERFPEITFQIANAESVPFADASFDLVAVSVVFTSILDRQMAANVAGEVSRILTPGGAVLWYDFRMNNPFNQHVRGVSRKHIQSLFPGFRVTLEAITLLPPLTRCLGPLARRLYAPLSGLRFLRTHLCGLLTKP